ncbi:MAG: GNAT family N-acetyltransferase, partial [Dehalococcoidales bacterium]|nr:GNAT family N-acetyltransferase [Dehalococcoidales bacterium]
TLFGLLRMRIQTTCGEGRWQAKPIARLGQEADGNLALIRELHVYGAEVPLQQHPSAEGPAAVQHKGLGKALLAEAERIAREEFQVPLMVVLSGTGAKEYYRSEGYYSHADYMVKRLFPRYGEGQSPATISKRGGFFV